jgi:putative nucleotidyltransferase with HDIG domain
MSLGAFAAASSIEAIMRYGFGLTAEAAPPLLAVTLAMVVASIVQLAANIILLSTLLALRHGNRIISHWKDFLWSVPLFLPTSAAANLMYLALQYDILVTALIAGPVLFAIYFGHRQFQDGVEKRIAVMEKAHRETIEALAVAINAKDEVTHEHVLRVQIYAAGVARVLNCSEQEIEALKAGALLHDIGKIAVPDYILNKPGKLTAAEFEKMKIHTVAGAQILSRVEFPYPIVPVVRHHHERWDGKGYPDGLKGDEIPLTARILSVVDCFDAVREDRQYRKGLTREEAIELIMRGSGSQYDPMVVGTFIGHLHEFEAEIEAMRNKPVPTFGIEPVEDLSEAARAVAPAAGLAEESGEKPQEETAEQDEMQLLCELAQALIAAPTSRDIAAVFVEKLKAIVSYDTCAVTRVLPELGDNVVIHAAGNYSHLLQGRAIALGEGVTGWVIANQKPFCNADPKLDLSPSLIEYFDGYRTLAAFPIIKGEDVYGAITLYSLSLSEYDARLQGLLKQVTSLLATAFSASLEREKEQGRLIAAINDDALNVISISKSGPLQLPDSVLKSRLTN